MNYTRLPFDDQYDIMNVMPRWAYHDDEWMELVVESDKMVDDVMYVRLEPEDEYLKFLLDLEIEGD